MIEISRIQSETSAILGVPPNSITVIDSFSVPITALGVALHIVPHGEYVRARLDGIVGKKMTHELDLVEMAGDTSGMQFVQALRNLEDKLNISIPNVVSVSAIPDLRSFDDTSLKEFHAIMQRLEKNGVIFVAALDNKLPDARSIRFPKARSPLYQYSIVVNGFIQKNGQFIPLGEDPTLAHVTSFSDFSISSGHSKSEKVVSAGNSLVAPEIAAGVAHVLHLLPFLLPNKNMSMDELEKLSRFRKKTVLNILSSAYVQFDSSSYFYRAFSLEKLIQIMKETDFSVLKAELQKYMDQTVDEENASSVAHAKTYDWGADFLPFEFGPGDLARDLLKRIKDFTSKFHGQSFHFVNNLEHYSITRDGDNYRLIHPEHPNAWLMDHLKTGLGSLVTEIGTPS